MLEKEFDEYFNTYYKTVYKVCYTYVLNNDLASDLTQDTFVKLYTKKIKHQNIHAWLIRVAKNLCIDYLRKHKREKICELIDIEDVNKPFDIIYYVYALPSKYQDVIIMYYYGQMKLEEVAQSLHLNLNCVKKRLERARNMLKSMMEEKYGN